MKCMVSIKGLKLDTIQLGEVELSYELDSEGTKLYIKEILVPLVKTVLPAIREAMEEMIR